MSRKKQVAPKVLAALVNRGSVTTMALRKQKSRKQQVADLAVDYLKLKTAAKAAKGAGTQGRQGHGRLQGGRRRRRS